MAQPYYTQQTAYYTPQPTQHTYSYASDPYGRPLAGAVHKSITLRNSSIINPLRLLHIKLNHRNHIMAILHNICNVSQQSWHGSWRRGGLCCKIKMKFNTPGKGPEVDHCGGTLIDSMHVVTAAHCIGADRSWSHIEVYAGADELHNPEMEKRIVPHGAAFFNPSFRYQNLQGDMAVLKLDRPFSNHKTTSLPMQSGVSNLSLTGAFPAKAYSFPVSGPRAGIPLKLETDLVITQADANSFYTAKRADGRNGGLCRGESGSGVIIRENGQRLLAGVLSGVEPEGNNASNCMKPGHEMYFTPIAPHRNFIEHVRSMSTNVSGYTPPAPTQQYTTQTYTAPQAGNATQAPTVYAAPQQNYVAQPTYAQPNYTTQHPVATYAPPAPVTTYTPPSTPITYSGGHHINNSTGLPMAQTFSTPPMAVGQLHYLQ